VVRANCMPSFRQVQALPTKGGDLHRLRRCELASVPYRVELTTRLAAPWEWSRTILAMASAPLLAYPEQKAAGAFLTGKQAMEATHPIFSEPEGNHNGSTRYRALTVRRENAEKTCVITVSGPDTPGARRYQTVELGKPSALHCPSRSKTKGRHIDTNGEDDMRTIEVKRPSQKMNGAERSAIMKCRAGGT
jgi:hypothetical protein